MHAAPKDRAPGMAQGPPFPHGLPPGGAARLPPAVARAGSWLAQQGDKGLRCNGINSGMPVVPPHRQGARMKGNLRPRKLSGASKDSLDELLSSCQASLNLLENLRRKNFEAAQGGAPAAPDSHRSSTGASDRGRAKGNRHKADPRGDDYWKPRCNTNLWSEQDDFNFVDSLSDVSDSTADASDDEPKATWNYLQNLPGASTPSAPSARSSGKPPKATRKQRPASGGLSGKAPTAATAPTQPDAGPPKPGGTSRTTPMRGASMPGRHTPELGEGAQTRQDAGGSQGSAARGHNAGFRFGGTAPCGRGEKGRGGASGGGGGEGSARTPAPPSAAARGAVAAPSAGSAHHLSSLDRGSGASPAYSAPGEVFKARQDRLQELASGFSIFERQLEQGTKARKVVELAHIQTIHSQSARVEQLLQQEAERAAECQRSVQRSLEGRLAEAQGKLESLFLDKFDSVHSALAALDERLHTVEGSFAQDCESYIHDMREESLSTRAESMEFNRSYREELSKRHDTEGSINARISELQQRTEHRLESEQQVSEQRWAQLAKDIADSNWAREAANKDYQDQLVAKVS
mmetsp:Transcript_110100/g.350745  ORF Transcript_110100/g.350745 Transcript_110100/m.350745 type:complete len:576 (-) Transcript_110100:369-2096(-)